MKHILLLAGFLLTFSPLFSQVTIHRDPTIESMIQELSRTRIQQDIEKLVSFHTRHTLSNQTGTKQGVGAALHWVKAEMEKSIPQSDGRLSVSFDSYPLGPNNRRVTRNVTLKNVIAVLKGTNPEDNRIFLVSAHLDSRGDDINDSTSYEPGADDDGSGVAALLEMVRIMSKHPYSGTLIFTVVTGEEQGLYGSRHIAEKAKKENWNLVAMLNNDMIGQSRSSGTELSNNTTVRVFSEGVPAYETEQMARLRAFVAGENDSKSRELARYVKEVGERYVDQLTVNLIYRPDRYGRGGDQFYFSKLGFTAVRICESHENYDRTHKVPRMENGVQLGDLPQFVDYEYVRKNTGINLATLASLAEAPYEPQHTQVQIFDLTNSTTLTWKTPDKGVKPAGYYVLMRATDQPMWQRKYYVTGNKVTLPYSKDNYIFAVQSVDSRGHESLPVIPLPQFKR
ncbi:MAG: M20/M25/M40 family metallo-hydrolase [Bacteroidales bacterium]|nr:M20/M25/M40 family metallo-hydrolase [Bacteroidales bacterium]